MKNWIIGIYLIVFSIWIMQWVIVNRTNKLDDKLDVLHNAILDLNHDFLKAELRNKK